jgi:hypothetical protein
MKRAAAARRRNDALPATFAPAEGPSYSLAVLRSKDTMARLPTVLGNVARPERVVARLAG